VLPEADVIGTDTHELSILHDDAEHEVAEEVPTEETPFDPREILTHHRMISALLDELGVDCIRVHAMEYHLAVMDSYLPPDAVRRGLEFAAINAATKASRGDVTSPADLETGLEYAPSERGREAVERLGEAVGEPVRNGVLASPSVVACPNRVVEDPAGTVGIGDVVSSSSFVREVAVANDAGETSG
jgi:ADP-dependent phosphofructokinase/glucokinase